MAAVDPGKMGMGQRGRDTGVGEGECRQEISYFMGIGKELVAIEDPGNAIGNHRASQERREKSDKPVFPKGEKAIRAFQCIAYYKAGNDEKKLHPQITIFKKTAEIIPIGGMVFPFDGEMI